MLNIIWGIGAIGDAKFFVADPYELAKAPERYGVD